MCWKRAGFVWRKLWQMLHLAEFKQHVLNLKSPLACAFFSRKHWHVFAAWLMLAWLFFLHFIPFKYQKGVSIFYILQTATLSSGAEVEDQYLEALISRCIPVSSAYVGLFPGGPVFLRGKKEEILSVHPLSHRHYCANKGMLEKFRMTVLLLYIPLKWYCLSMPSSEHTELSLWHPEHWIKMGRDFLWKPIASEQQHIKIPKSTGSWYYAWSTQALH